MQTPSLPKRTRSSEAMLPPHHLRHHGGWPGPASAGGLRPQSGPTVDVRGTGPCRYCTVTSAALLAASGPGSGHDAGIGQRNWAKTRAPCEPGGVGMRTPVLPSAVLGASTNTLGLTYTVAPRNGTPGRNGLMPTHRPPQLDGGAPRQVSVNPASTASGMPLTSMVSGPPHHGVEAP